MALATRFVQPIDYTGQYRTSSWAGYVFKETLGYTSGRHTGVDYNFGLSGNDDYGRPIRAVANGIVRATGNYTSKGYGWSTIIEHPLSAKLKAELGCDSLFSRIMHQSRIDVSVGQEVSVGQTVGLVGNSGTQWAHLHIDLYKSTIDGGGVHWRYDKDTQLSSYLDVFEFIQAHLADSGESLLGNQRILENKTGVYQREAPTRNSAVMKDWPYDLEPFTFKGFVRGEDVNGNNIWFVGAYSGGYFWSGAFLDKGTHDLPDLTPVSPIPDPKPPEPPVVFAKELECVTKVVPAHPTNYQVTDFPASPVGVVLHDFGSDGKDTFDSSLNHFANPDTTAPHFTVSGSQIVQNGKLTWRMYHAGPQGNDKIGVEIDPDVDTNPATKASVELLIKELEAKFDKKLTRHLHSEYMATSCGDDITKAGLIKPDVPESDLEPRVIALETQVKKLTDFNNKTFKEWS